jgi:hypothetical protein
MIVSARPGLLRWNLALVVGIGLIAGACGGTDLGAPPTSRQDATRASVTTTTTPTRDLRVSFFTNYGYLHTERGGSPECGHSFGKVTAATMAAAIDSSGRVAAAVPVGSPELEPIGGGEVGCTFVFGFDDLPDGGDPYAIRIKGQTVEFGVSDWREYDWDVRVFDQVVP